VGGGGHMFMCCHGSGLLASSCKWGRVDGVDLRTVVLNSECRRQSSASESGISGIQSKDSLSETL